MYAICNGFTGETERMFNGKLALMSSYISTAVIQTRDLNLQWLPYRQDGTGEDSTRVLSIDRQITIIASISSVIHIQHKHSVNILQ